MSVRNLILCSAASLAFASMLFARPVYAHHQDQFATAEEHARAHRVLAPPEGSLGTLVVTQSLTPATSVTTSVAPAPSYSSALSQHNQAVADYNAAQAQYQQQLRDYQRKYGSYAEQQRTYQENNQAYQAQSDIYQGEARAYDNEVARYVEPLPPPSEVIIFNRAQLRYPDRHQTLIELDSLIDPTFEAGGAPVEDRFGNVVGRFRQLTYQDEGRERAAIVLNNNKMIVIDDEHLRYDPAQAVVVADLSYDEMNSFPARF